MANDKLYSNVMCILYNNADLPTARWACALAGACGGPGQRRVGHYWRPGVGAERGHYCLQGPGLRLGEADSLQGLLWTWCGHHSLHQPQVSN